MPATTKSGRVKGEGRVISINAKYGFLAAQGINSKVFIIPSSLKIDAPFPALTDELHIDDLVTFEANEQAERNGAKYLAVDGSVKLKQRGRDVMVEGDGKIVRLDAVRGCFGFIDSPKVGSVFFNVSAVRPGVSDVTKVFKLGQKVKFRALPNSEQPNCKWRASVVCAFAKANEFLHTTTSNGTTTKVGTASTVKLTKTLTDATGRPTQGQKKGGARSGSADNRRQNAARSCRSASSSFHVSSENLAAGTSCVESSNCHTPDASYSNDTAKIAGGGYSTPTTANVSSSPPLIHLNGNGASINYTMPVATSGGYGNVAAYGPQNGCVNGTYGNPQSNGHTVGGGGWPTPRNGGGVDADVNPAALWDSYLEQQQKALSQTFNPFSGGGGGTATCSMSPAFFRPSAATSSNFEFTSTCEKPYTTPAYSNPTATSTDYCSYLTSPPLSSNGNTANSSILIGRPSSMDDSNVVVDSHVGRNSLRNHHLHGNNAIPTPTVGQDGAEHSLFYDQSPDDICRHIKKLAHELNGWPGGDKCAYCLSEEMS